MFNVTGTDYRAAAAGECVECIDIFLLGQHIAPAPESRTILLSTQAQRYDV